MRSPHVVVGYHHWGLVGGKFCYSLARAVAYEGGRIKGVIQHPSPYTDEARNRIVETFLLMPPCDYLLMVDADIEFEKDAISRTMQVAQNLGADVVWGNYALGSFANSLFMKDKDTELAVSIAELEPNVVVPEVYGGGTGWCLMKRDLLEEMREKCPGPWHWFPRDLVKNEKGEDILMGEDLSFGRRVWNLGGKKQFGFTGIFLVHHKLTATIPHFMGGIAEELGTPMTNMEGKGIV